MAGYQQNEGMGGLPRQDPGSLNAPGLAATTRVYSSNAERVQQALAVMGQGAQVFQQATSLYAHDREFQDQRARGQAAQDWAIQRAAVKQQIDDGTYTVDDPTSADELKNTHAAIAAGYADGKGPNYAKHYLAISGGETSAWLAGAAQDRQDTARFNASYDLENAAMANATPQEHATTYDQLRKLNPKWNDAQLDLPFLKAGTAAAEMGDSQKTLAAIEFLGNRHPEVQAKWEAALVKSSIDANKAQQQGIMDQVDGFLADEKTLEAKAFFDAHKDQLSGDNRLKATESINSRDEKTRQRDETNALQGVKDAAAVGVDPEKLTAQIDHLGGIYGNAWRDKAVKEHQEVYADNLKRDIGLGRFKPGADGRPDVNATLGGVIQDMDRPANDPRHISPELGLSILKETEKRMEFDAQSAVVMNRLTAGPGAGGMPLGEKQDAALTNALGANFGVLQGVSGKEGQFVPTAITAPLKLAGLADKAGRVPKDVAGLIQRGMAGDANEVTRAAQSLAALQAQNPALAEQVISDMAPVAQMRARELQSQVDLGSYVKPQSDDPAQLAQGQQTNQRLFNTLATMQYKPVPEAELKLAVYGPDAKAQAEERQKIITDAFTVPEHEWLRIRDFKPDLNTAQRSEFFDMFEQEYQTALSRTGNDAQAKGIAKTKAATRFALQHQQIVWNGQAITTDAPRQLGDPAAFRDAVEKELRDSGWAETPINDVLNSTHPVWDSRNKAWRFKDQMGNDYTYSTPTESGKPLAISLIPTTSKYAPEKVAELEKRIRDAKAAKESKPAQPNPYDGMRYFQ